MMGIQFSFTNSRDAIALLRFLFDKEVLAKAEEYGALNAVTRLTETVAAALELKGN
jgi:hypothetical protein